MPASTTPTRPDSQALSPARKAAAAFLVPAAAALFIGILGMPLEPALWVGGAFVGVTTAARVLSVNADALSGPLGWLARVSEKLWSEWGTGFYGLASLTSFILRESRSILELGFSREELFAQPVATLVGWLVGQSIEGITNAIAAFFWWLELSSLWETHGGGPVVGVVLAGWLFWRLLRIPETPEVALDLGLDEIWPNRPDRRAVDGESPPAATP